MRSRRNWLHGFLICGFGFSGFSQKKDSAIVTPAVIRLAAAAGKKSNELGYSVAVSEKTAVLGAPYAGEHPEPSALAIPNCAAGCWSRRCEFRRETDLWSRLRFC